MNPCEKQIRAFGKFAPKSLWGLFCQKGRARVVEPLTREEAAYIGRVTRSLGGRKVFKVKQCYMNAQRLKLNDFDNRLKYVEGYFMSTHQPVALSHAWVEIGGKVVDVTAEALIRQNKARESETWYYFGVEVSERLLMKNALMTEVHGPVTENYGLAELVWGKTALNKVKHSRR